jgi:membrane protein YdbS with pleckstrin-like domain
MTNNWFDEFLNQYYLIALVMLLVALSGLAICISQTVSQKASTLRIMFMIYFAIILMQGLTTVIYTYLTYPDYSETVNLYSEYIFAVLEFVVFSIILHHILCSKKAKYAVRFTTIGFLLSCIFIFPPDLGFSANSYRAAIVSAFLLIGHCLVYFYELFLYEPTKKLTNEPAFWTATGILLYLVCLIPNLLVLQFVSPIDYLKYAGLAYINFFASSTLYVFFIKALLCKTSQVTLLSS